MKYIKSIICILSVFLINSCFSGKETSINLFRHEDRYKYHLFDSQFTNRETNDKEGQNSMCRLATGLENNEKSNSQFITVSSLTIEQVIEIKTKNLEFEVEELKFINIISLTEMMQDALNTNDEIDIVLHTKFKRDIKEFYTDSVLNKKLDAKGISEKINKGVVEGDLPTALYPFDADKLNSVNFSELLKTIKYVYDLEIFIPNFSNIYLFEPGEEIGPVKLKQENGSEYKEEKQPFSDLLEKGVRPQKTDLPSE